MKKFYLLYIILCFILISIIIYKGIIKFYVIFKEKNNPSNKYYNIRKLVNEEEKLNNIINIYYPEDKVYFISCITNKNGDLFFLTNNANVSTTRLVYAIKKDGSNYFEDTDKPYKILTANKESNNSYPILTMYYINGIEYLASFSLGSYYELLDLENNIAYFTYQFQVISVNGGVKKSFFFSLDYYNNEKYIINGYTSRKNDRMLNAKSN